jgi:hypothetical protein
MVQKQEVSKTPRGETRDGILLPGMEANPSKRKAGKPWTLNE